MTKYCYLYLLDDFIKSDCYSPLVLLFCWVIINCFDLMYLDWTVAYKVFAGSCWWKKMFKNFVNSYCNLILKIWFLIGINLVTCVSFFSPFETPSNSLTIHLHWQFHGFTWGVGKKKTPRPTDTSKSPSQLLPATTGVPKRRTISGVRRVLLL